VLPLLSLPASESSKGPVGALGDPTAVDFPGPRWR
jgi:hypothetical protein